MKKLLKEVADAITRGVPLDFKQGEGDYDEPWLEIPAYLREGYSENTPLGGPETAYDIEVEKKLAH